MKIKFDSRLHRVLTWIENRNGRYCECWTEKTVAKLVEGGYVKLVDAPDKWGWGMSRTCSVTDLGRQAISALKTSKIFAPNG